MGEHGSGSKKNVRKKHRQKSYSYLELGHHWDAINSKQIVRWRYLSRMKKDTYCKAEKYFSLIQNAAG